MYEAMGDNESNDPEFDAKLEVVGDRDVLTGWLESSKEFFEQ